MFSHVRNGRADIRHAFQPVVDLNTRTTHHFEALYRADSPTADVGEAIRAMEISGGIIEHDIEAMKSLAKLADKWAIPIAMNISALSLSDSAFRATALKTLLSMRRPEQLHFELTETMPITNIPNAQRFVSGVRSLGCWVSLDDFGSGHFTPDSIHDLRPDLVKIDRSLTQEMVSGQPGAATQFRSVLAMAREANARVVAEGIESVMGLHAVRSCGVEYGQGYYLGMPSLVREWLQAGRPGRRSLEGSASGFAPA